MNGTNLSIQLKYVLLQLRILFYSVFMAFEVIFEVQPSIQAGVSVCIKPLQSDETGSYDVE